MGRLIVFEGIDGSGKSTQFQRLCACMSQAGITYTKLSFPRYDKPSSALIRMYLAGEFGTNPSDVSPYAASTFYAVDRWAAYQSEWAADYAADTLILADRYTTSNAVHQGAKLHGDKRVAFFQWLDEFEHEKLELPRPDIVLYMDVDAETAFANLRARQEKTATAPDIHEGAGTYLQSCLSAAVDAAKFYGWHSISCAENGVMRAEEDIHREILGKIDL